MDKLLQAGAPSSFRLKWLALNGLVYLRASPQLGAIRAEIEIEWLRLEPLYLSAEILLAMLANALASFLPLLRINVSTDYYRSSSTWRSTWPVPGWGRGVFVCGSSDWPPLLQLLRGPLMQAPSEKNRLLLVSEANLCRLRSGNPRGRHASPAAPKVARDWW